MIIEELNALHFTARNKDFPVFLKSFETATEKNFKINSKKNLKN